MTHVRVAKHQRHALLVYFNLCHLLHTYSNMLEWISDGVNKTDYDSDSDSDLIGSLPLSSSDNLWIIVAVNHNTRYAKTKALSTATTPAVAMFILYLIILRHGPPRELLTDQDALSCSAYFPSSSIHALLYTRGLRRITLKSMGSLNGEIDPSATCYLCIFPSIAAIGRLFFRS